MWALFLLTVTPPASAQPPPDTIPLISDQFLTEAQPQLRPARDYVPLRIGDKWTFRVGSGSASANSAATLRVANMKTIGGAEVYCLERQLSPTSDVTKECYSLGADGVYCHHMLQTDLEPPVLILKTQIVPENAYTAATKVGGKDLTFSITVREDPVEVPAGDFQAIRVAVTTNTRYQFEYWLAPHIGFVKMSMTHGPTTLNLDLQKFELGTKE
jgi:hypothetical protein